MFHCIDRVCTVCKNWKQPSGTEIYWNLKTFDLRPLKSTKWTNPCLLYQYVWKNPSEWEGLSTNNNCSQCFDLILNILVTIFSIMSGRNFLAWTSTKQRIKCLAQRHNTVSPVRLEPAMPQPQVKHSTTEPQHSSSNDNFSSIWKWKRIGISCELSVGIL